MVAHELATLNETRQENAELKRTAEHLRSRNEGLLKRNIALSEANNQYKDASSALGAAVNEIYGMAGVRKVKERAAEILQMQPADTKPNKRNRPSQVVS